MSKLYNLGEGSAHIVKSNEDKKIILNYLFKSINLANYRFQILKTIDQLEFLKTNDHYVSPNFYGVNYLIIFMKLNNKCKTFMIDRKRLRYNKEEIDLKTLLILEININCDSCLYNGTILDGKLIKLENNKYILICNDCYYLYGNNLNTQTLENKYETLNKVLNSQIESNSCYNFNIKINKLYNYDELDNVINKIIPNVKLPINGIVFYPKYSGSIIIFSDKQNSKYPQKIDNKNVPLTNFKKNECDNKDESYHIVRDLVRYLKSRTLISKNDFKNLKLKEFFLRKSDIPDVYHIIEDEGKPNIGIAHIPNITISHTLDNFFENKNIIKFSCYYNTQFKKWTPVLN